MASINIMLDLIGRDMTGSAFASAVAGLTEMERLGRAANQSTGNIAAKAKQQQLQFYAGALVGASAALAVFTGATKLAVDQGAALEMATTMAGIAIKDGTQHTQELSAAILALANNSQYQIQDVDQAFRMLGERGFTTAQILQGGLGQASINLGQAMGDTAVNGADVLSQALRLMTNDHLSASKASDELTRAFYDGMPAASSLSTFLGMAGGTANNLHMSLNDLLVAGDLLTPVMGGASQAGASLNYMLNQLVAPTGPAADGIKKLHLQVFDATGHFVGFKNVIDQLIQKMKNMPDAEKFPLIRELFSTRSGRGAQDLIGMLGQFDTRYASIAADIAKVGTAQKDASLINDTAAGSWKRLTTTFMDFFARAGEVINGALKPIYNWLNNLLSVAQKNPLINHFFAAFLVGGVALSAVVVPALALVVAGLMGLLPLIGAAIGVFAVIAGAAGLLAGLFTILSTRTNLFHGQLAFLNPVVDAVRAAFGFLGNIWSHTIIPLIIQFAPLWKAIGIALLVVAGIIVGVLVGSLLVVAGAVTLVILGVMKLIQFLGFLVGIVWNAGKAVVQAFAAVPGQIGNYFSQLGTFIRNALQNLVNQAPAWGRNLIQGFINGIFSMFGAVGNAVAGVANTVRKFIGFKSPTEEGPGSEMEVWGPNLVKGFARGMLSEVGVVSSASSTVAGAVRSGILGGVNGTQLAATVRASGGGGGGTGTVVIPVYVGTKQVAQVVYDSLKGTLQQNGMSRMGR